VSPERRP
jgi:hypothetical protein